MLKRMKRAAKEWGGGGRVAWIGLVLPYLILMRVSELFAEEDGRVHVVYFLIGKGVAFYTDEWQVERGNHPGVDPVEVTFRGSKGDQGQKGAVLVRTKDVGNKGDEVVGLLHELYQIN